MSILFLHFFAKFNQISPLECNFTEVLNTIALTPKTLYFYGKMPENVAKSQSASASVSTGSRPSRPKTVAIVGSRHNTPYGREIAYQLGYELGKRGVVVVSGLAYGIDSIGHQGCLDAGGTTVAILGTPIDQIYPKEHLDLATKIVKSGGAIISEYPPATDLTAPLAPGEAGFTGKQWVSYQAQNSPEYIATPFIRRYANPKYSFLYRNRLIAGLSDAVIVVEAAVRSGSLNTATHALEQGRDVFAVPGNITSPYSQGCNKLIAEGATPCTEPADILRTLFPDEYLHRERHLRHRGLIGDTDAETLVLQALARGFNCGDDIMQVTKLPAEVFSRTATILEIKNRLQALGGNHWALIK